MHKVDFENMEYINIRGTSQPYFYRSLNLPEYNIIIVDSVLGANVSIWGFVNIYNAEIGENTKIASFVEIGKGVKIGKNCKIEAFSFIPEGVTIEDNVFIGPNTIFTNDKYPSAINESWKITPTIVKKGASIGAGSRIMCGITIGENSVIGMGSIVVSNVIKDCVYYGEKACLRGRLH